MQTRLSKMSWMALCVGVFLMGGSPGATHAVDWSKCKIRCKKTDDCPQDDVDCPDDECPDGDQNCPRQKRRCRWCHGQGCRYCCSCYKPTNAWYCDWRDRQVYAAQGFNVPVTVPLAPNCRAFNYGWGIPSTRLSQVGSYGAWYPDQPYSQSGGKLPGIYPVIYHPTDTTQTG